MRTSSPCVALPFGPGPRATGTRRVSAPSRLAQRDVAKTWYPANLLRSSPSFRSKDAAQGSWRRAERLPTHSLGGRVPDCGDGPIERKPNNENYLLILRELPDFLNGTVVDDMDINSLLSITWEWVSSLRAWLVRDHSNVLLWA